MSDDLKARPHNHGGAICEEAILRIESLEKQVAEAGKDAERLDFVIKQRTSWYGDHEPNNIGILCWGLSSRSETRGTTLREAIDAAIKEDQHG